MDSQHEILITKLCTVLHANGIEESILDRALDTFTQTIEAPWLFTHPQLVDIFMRIVALHERIESHVMNRGVSFDAAFHEIADALVSIGTEH